MTEDKVVRLVYKGLVEGGGRGFWLGLEEQAAGCEDLGPGSSAGSRADCWPPGGRLVNWVPFCFTSVHLKLFLLEAFTTHLTIYFLPQIFFFMDICMDPFATLMFVERISR